MNPSAFTPWLSRRLELLGAALAAAIVVAVVAASGSSAAPTTPYPLAVLADGPVAYWRLGEASGNTAVDASPSRINATYKSGPIRGVAGALAGDPDTAITLNGSPYVAAPTSATLNPNLLTVEAWARVTGGSGRQRAIVVSRSTDNNSGYVLFAGADNRWAFSVGGGTTAFWSVVSGPAVTLSRWTHLVGVYDGSTVRLYVDGAEAGSLATDYSPNRTRATRLGMGESDTGSSWSLIGSLDEVAIYAKALSSTRIAVHYSLGTTKVTAPVNTALPTIAGTARIGSTLTATTGTWSGTSPAFTAQWQRCTAAGASCVAIAGGTGSAYVVATVDVGSTLRVVVTAGNSAGSAVAASVVTAVVVGVAPASVVAPVVAGVAVEGATLSATAGTWSGTAPIVTALQWQRCTAAGASCVAIAGATGPEYLLAAADVGSRLRVDVTATNAAGSATAVSAVTAVIVLVAPVNTAPPTVAGVARSGSQLTATVGSWIGAISTAVQWKRCDSTGACVAIPGATGTAYDPLSGDAGATLRVDVTATNDGGATVATSAATAIVDRSYADVVRADSPLSWWPLNEAAGTTATDAVGGRGGAYLRTPLLGQPGALAADPSLAASFDGTTQYAEVPYSPALNPNGSFSVEAWVKVTGGVGRARSVVTSRDYTTTPFGFALYADPANRWQVLLGTTGGWVALQGSPVTLNQWTHVVVTYDTWPTVLRLYVNGALTGLNTSTLVYSPNPGRSLRIGSGRTETTPTYFLPGMVDEVAVYGTALTPSSVAAHYRAGGGVHDFVPAAPVNPIQAENRLPGSVGWQRQPTATVEGYSSEVSVLPGGSLHLHVSASVGTRYRVEVYRLGWYGGSGARLVGCLPDCAGDEAGAKLPVPAPDPVTGMIVAGWPVTDTVAVDPSWPAGVYVASLLVTGGAEIGRSSMVPFVVREPAGKKASILVQLGVNTWQAYNNWGGKSLYNANSTGANLPATGTPGAVKVSFDRPYRVGGALMWPWEAYAGVPTVWDWDVQLVRFLEREGYDVSYTTDVDTDADPSSLLGRKAVMVSGHDEYWSKATYDALFAARDAGVSLAFVGGNIGGSQIRYEDGARTVVDYRVASLDPNPDPAQKTTTFQLLGRPECTLLGVGIQTGVATHRLDYGVVSAALGDPLFAGTGFVAGGTLPWGVGYEWDGIVPGCAVPTPTSLFHLDTQWGPADVTRYTAVSGARVFSTSSLQLSWLLDDFLSDQPADARLQQLMRNVLADMLR